MNTEQRQILPQNLKDGPETSNPRFELSRNTNDFVAPKAVNDGLELLRAALHFASGKSFLGRLSH